MNPIIVIHVVLVLLAVVVFAVGLLLPRKKSAQRAVELRAIPEEIWGIVTSVEQQARWRSDLKNIQIVERTPETEVWTEYPKSGTPLTFKTRKKIPYTRYEIETVNSTVFSGRRVVIFEELSKDATKIIVTECAEIRNPLMRLLAHLYFNFGATIDHYMKDLTVELHKKLERLSSQTS